MAGIYIHVPFCKQACSYCNFYFVVNPLLKNLYLEGLQLQIQQNQNFFKKNEVNSIYLGGGSPSMLTADELTQIFSQLPRNKSAEITLEANPDDISLE
jgi:oxygen-independent coproporphyrinogen-3 oxidase